MPKAERIRNRVHLSSAKLKPSDNHVASAYSSSVSQVEAEELPVQPQFTLRPTKKEKHLERRESFLRKLGHGLPSLSKSHARRIKRKAKEQLAGDTLADLSQALPTLEADNDSAKNAQDPPDIKADIEKPQQKVGLIGEGKSRPLSKSQRKRMLDLERFRHPLILQNPEFSANPFQTIQIHAKNTLLKHTPSTS